MTAATVCNRRPTATWTRCTCVPCRAEMVRKKKLYGAGLRFPDQRAQATATLLHLVSRGWSASAIATATGIPVKTLNQLVERANAGQPVVMHYATARLLGHVGTPTAGWVGPHGPARRLQALAAMGWPLDVLAERTGVAASSLSVVRTGHRSKTAAVTAARVAEVYGVLSMRRGPSETTTRLAAQQGWAPPLAWEDDEIDDPDAVPNIDGKNGAARRPRGGSLFEIEDVEFLLSHDPTLTAELVAARLGASRNTVLQRLARAGRRDLLDRLNIIAATGRTGRWGK